MLQKIWCLLDRICELQVADDRHDVVGRRLETGEDHRDRPPHAEPGYADFDVPLGAKPGHQRAHVDARLAHRLEGPHEIRGPEELAVEERPLGVAATVKGELHEEHVDAERIVEARQEKRLFYPRTGFEPTVHIDNRGGPRPRARVHPARADLLIGRILAGMANSIARAERDVLTRPFERFHDAAICPQPAHAPPNHVPRRNGRREKHRGGGAQVRCEVFHRVQPRAADVHEARKPAEGAIDRACDAWPRHAS
jgi:hypothetical protein